MSLDDTSPLRPVPPPPGQLGRHRRHLGMGIRTLDQMWHRIICRYDMYLLPGDRSDVCHPEVQIGLRPAEFRAEVLTECARGQFADPCDMVPIFDDSIDPYYLCPWCWVGLR
jgi:hypothetical protein